VGVNRVEAGFKIRQIFFGAERSGGAVLEKISGAVERKFLKISIFLVFLMKFSRKFAQKGPKRSQITPDALAR
jgi:hypothetical protein